MKNISKIAYKKFSDSRGYFFELYNKKKIKKNFKQVNISYSKKNVIRGLHYQLKKPQEKFVTVLKGKILDVCIDLRNNSKTFGQYKFFKLEENKKKLDDLTAAVTGVEEKKKATKKKISKTKTNIKKTKSAKKSTKPAVKKAKSFKAKYKS